MSADYDPYYVGVRVMMCEEAGRLESAQYGSYPELPEFVSAVLLNFERQSWMLHVCIDDDTVRISDLRAIDDADFSFYDPSSMSPWLRTIGKSAFWV